MSDKIPSNSTIKTVWNHLASPREYVAGIRHRMETCLKAHGNAHVKIGVTGTGQKPCYRIFNLDGADSPNEVIYASNWDNHQPLSKEDALNGNWSSQSMTFQEVDALLKEKIGWKK